MSMNNLSVDGEFRYIVQWFSEWSELQRDDFVPILVEYLLRDTPTPGVYMNGVVHSLSASDITNKPMSLFQCRIKLFRQWSPKWPEDFKNALKEKICEMDTRIGEKIAKSLVNHQNGDVSSDIDAIEEFPNIAEPIVAASTTNATTTSASPSALPSALTVTATVNILGSTRPYVRQNLNNNAEVKNAKEETKEILTEVALDTNATNNAPNVALPNTTTTEKTGDTEIEVETETVNIEAIDADHHLAEVLRKETPVDDDDDDVDIENDVTNEQRVLAVNNAVQDNITRVTVNATDSIINDVAFGNGYAVEPVEQDPVEHVVTNSSPVTVNVSVSTTSEVSLVA